MPTCQYDLANSLKAAAESASPYHPHFAEWPESNTEPAIMQMENEKSKYFDNIAILNKSENATPELFATYIQNYANQECN